MCKLAMSLKLNVSEEENKILVREKKYHENDIFKVGIVTFIIFDPLTFFLPILKVHTQGFQHLEKIQQNYQLK